MSTGVLWLVPTPLDHGYPEAERCAIESTLPLSTLQQAAKISHWITENAKSTRGFLKRVHSVYPLPCELQAMHWLELPREIQKKGDHLTQDLSQVRDWLRPALDGHDMGLVSEAGMPAIADPGSSVVRAAHALGIQVRALGGPVSLMLALASSGLNGQAFAFHGYLQLGEARIEQIRQLDRAARQTGQTQIVIETPYRNAALLELLVRTLSSDSRLVTASGLSVSDQVISCKVSEWRKRTPPTLDGPTVFLWGPV